MFVYNILLIHGKPLVESCLYIYYAATISSKTIQL